MAHREKIAKLLTVLALTAPVTACGGNILASQEKKDPPEDAALALEQGNPTKAIEIVENELNNDPENSRLLSLLATAYAERAGVDPLSLAQGLSSGDGSGSGSGSSSSSGGLIALFDVMPEATEDSVTDIDYAVELLTSISTDERTNGDLFKYAIYQTASLVLHLKILDVNGDGELSIDEIISLSDLIAGSLVNQLASAQATLATQGGDSATMLQASETLATFQSQIDASDGATIEDKLRTYIATSTP